MTLQYSVNSIEPLHLRQYLHLFCTDYATAITDLSTDHCQLLAICMPTQRSTARQMHLIQLFKQTATDIAYTNSTTKSDAIICYLTALPSRSLASDFRISFCTCKAN